MFPSTLLTSRNEAFETSLEVIWDSPEDSYRRVHIVTRNGLPSGFVPRLRYSMSGFNMVNIRTLGQKSVPLEMSLEAGKAEAVV